MAILGVTIKNDTQIYIYSKMLQTDQNGILKIIPSNPVEGRKNKRCKNREHKQQNEKNQKSIIVLNVNGLNTLIQRQRMAKWIKKKSNNTTITTAQPYPIYKNSLQM